MRNGYHAVRYNSRGVGKSSGWPSFSGQQEVKDLQEVVQWSLQHVENVGRVVIAVSSVYMPSFSYVVMIF